MNTSPAFHFHKADDDDQDDHDSDDHDDASENGQLALYYIELQCLSQRSGPDYLYS